MLGRIDENKNQRMAIEAFLSLDYQNSLLYIFGEGSDKESLVEYVNKNNLQLKIIIGSFQDNPFKWISHCDCLILNSTFEGFPNVILEALACGKPVISSNCDSGPSEILRGKNKSTEQLEFTEHGILFPVGNQELLKEAMGKMVNEENIFEKYYYLNYNRAQSFSLENLASELNELLFY